MPYQYFVDCFAGGMNLIDKVDGYRIANDINPNIISLFHVVQLGWVPPTSITKEEYYEIKNNQNHYNGALIGFVEFGCSFGGKSWGGYAHNTEGRNYALYSHNVLLKQAKKLQDVVFTCGDYQDIDIPDQSIIYLDPPYRGTTKYKTGFDYERFYEWCHMKKDEGHKVFISEYNMPSDFECILEIPLNTILNKNKISNRVERLYIPK
jgi:DNA adenine methylase